MTLKNIVWFPVIFAIFFIIINYFFVWSLEKALTHEAEEIFQQKQLQMLFASSLFLYPNLFLSFLLWTYKKNYPGRKRDLRILCFTAIACGLLPQIFIYAAYYSLWYEWGAKIPFVLFGFPFVYLFGMLMGWVIGLWIVSLRAP